MFSLSKRGADNDGDESDDVTTRHDDENSWRTMRTWLHGDAEINSLAVLRVDGEHETGSGDTDENGGPGWNTAATPLDETTVGLVRGVVDARAKERPDTTIHSNTDFRRIRRLYSYRVNKMRV